MKILKTGYSCNINNGYNIQIIPHDMYFDGGFTQLNSIK